MKYLLAALCSLLILSCSKKGCTDPEAYNYSEAASSDDGSCDYTGCTDPLAKNYFEKAKRDDGSCTYYMGKVKFRFEHFFESQALKLNQVYYLNSTSIRFTTAKFYVSLPHVHGNYTTTDHTYFTDVHFLVSADSSGDYLAGETRSGEYVGYKFGFGVDTVTNSTKAPLDYTEPPLSDQSMLKTSNGRNSFYFVFLEGQFDLSGSPDPQNRFSYRIGDNKYWQEINFPERSFNLPNDGEVVLQTKVDWSQWFHQVYLSRQNYCDSTGSLSDSLSKAIPYLFSSV
jgi:hypothetical protein